MAQCRQSRLLVLSAALQCVAVALAVLSQDGLHQLVPMFAGAALTVAYLCLPLEPEAAPRPYDRPSAAGAAENEARLRLTSAPHALPFMGERLALRVDHDGVTRLARIASQLGKMTAVKSHPWGELMARISHELRTPLNAVIGFSDVMSAELFGPVGNPRYKEYASHIHACGRELLKSAEDTLAMTCLLGHEAPTDTTDPLDLSAIAHEAWNFYREDAAARSIRLTCDIPGKIEVLAERRPMRQTLINLFSEAMRRSRDAGVIGVSACIGGGLVQLEIFVHDQIIPDKTGQASLNVCLARALLELQGAALIEVDDACSTWRALTVLRQAAQADFFNSPYLFEQQPVRLC